MDCLFQYCCFCMLFCLGRLHGFLYLPGTALYPLALEKGGPPIWMDFIAVKFVEDATSCWLSFVCLPQGSCNSIPTSSFLYWHSYDSLNMCSVMVGKSTSDIHITYLNNMRAHPYLPCGLIMLVWITPPSLFCTTISIMVPFGILVTFTKSKKHDMLVMTLLRVQ